MSYQPPTPDELKDLIHNRFGLSRKEAGDLADIDKGIIGKWSIGRGVIPYSVLATIVNRMTGKTVTPDNWRNELD